MIVENFELQNNHIKMISKTAKVSFNKIHYNNRESRFFGVHNCCYRKVYDTPVGKYAVVYSCGCEYQTVADGTMAYIGIIKL